MTGTEAVPTRVRKHRLPARVLSRIPATITLAALVLAVGIATQGLWRPVADQSWFPEVAYGLPSFEAGRWWTPLTGTFLVAHPLVFLVTVPSFIGIGYLEWRRGTRVALSYFAIGQLFAVLATAAVLMLARLLPWPWAVELAQTVDVGPSGGSMACLAAAAGLLPAPWRQRAWVAVFSYASIGLLFLGTLADVEHALAIVLVLAVDRSLRIQRTTVREQRLIAFAILLSLGVVQILGLLVPTSGPFGTTEPLAGPWLDVAIDTVVVVLLARGLRLGRRWAWVCAVVWASVNTLVGALLLVLALVVDDRDDEIALVGEVDVTIGAAVLWLGFLVYLLATRRAFRSRRRHRLSAAPAGGERARSHRARGGTAPGATVADVKELIRTDGGGTLSWMTTWDGMQYFRSGTGIVPFQTHLGVAIVLGDPLGPAEGRAESVREFASAAEANGLIPCFFGASDASARATPASWRSLVVADDTIVDLPDIAFTGKPWAQVRQALNRGERDGMTFRLAPLADEPWGVRQQLRAISESWVGDKDLPEMRFTLGTLEEAADPEVRIASAIADNGDVDGFLSWLPVYGEGGEHRGWTLDLMRRRDGGFPPVMEFLIGSSVRAFAEEGARIASLSGAPLAHDTSKDDGGVAQLLSTLSHALEPVYGFRSLHRFKTKFNPRYESLHLLYRDEGDLTRIAAGLTRAFLPDATLRQFAAAGLNLLRRD